jgi:hypothetical protein
MISKVKESGSLSSGKVALCVFIFIIGLIIFSHQEKSTDRDINHRIFVRVIGFSATIVMFGFFVCGASIKLGKYHGYRLKRTEKQHVLDNIFGFLAGLAITTALITYYDNYLAIQNFEPWNDSPFADLGSKIDSGYFIPTLHLISFFMIAIPLTHSGYHFLSTLANDSSVTQPVSKNADPSEMRKKKNAPFRLIGVFIISIILIAFLFFLGDSIARSIEKIETVGGEGQTIKKYMNIDINASTAFISWLILIFIVMIVWSLLIRYLIPTNEYQGKIGERIHSEWIWLDVLTLGFLIAVYLTIFRLDLIATTAELSYFNILLSAILILRAVLNYYIGRNVYFPWPA